MKKFRLFGGIFATLIAVMSALILWHVRANVVLGVAALQLNHLYGIYRPFQYRWTGADHGVVQGSLNQTQAIDLKARLAGVEAKIIQAETLLGRNARTLQLHARLVLLSHDWHSVETAVADDNLALLLEPENASIHLDLGVALALRAETENRPLDYELALEHLLEAERKEPTPETEFNLALLMDDIPLPLQAASRWQAAANLELRRAWRDEIQARNTAAQEFLSHRARLIDEVTTSPGSYLSHADEAPSRIELVLDEALTRWLPDLENSAETREALLHIAQVLNGSYKDPWLSDLLRAPASPENSKAMLDLSESIRENFRAYHEHAFDLAAAAEHLFFRAGNPAGVFRAQFEQIYALDRRSKTEDCLRKLGQTRLTRRTHQLHYVWIEAQARLEQVTCETKTRKTDVIAKRQMASSWVSKTGYAGLYLRALSFQTEKYVSFDSRARLWRRGREGLLSFWRRPLPSMRGYVFYYTLASSAKEAKDNEAALVLLQESAQLLSQTWNRQVEGLVLSELGLWQTESGQRNEASSTFNKMSFIFEKVEPSEMEGFSQEAEVIRAEAERIAGHPQSSLEHLQYLTRGLSFPYSNLDLNVRRRLLPAFGNAALAMGRTNDAKQSYIQIIDESRRQLKSVRNPAQRNNAQAEIESAWRGLTQVSLEQGNNADAVAVWEAFRGGRWRDPSPEPLKPPEGVAILVYGFFDNRLSGWLVTPNGIDQTWLDARSVRRTAAQFSGLASDPDSPLPAVTAAGRKLYTLLVQPFAAALPKTGTIIIDAEGPLAGIPWVALEDSQGHALVERFAISQVIGWSEVSSRLAQSSVSLERPLIVAEPAFSHEFAEQYPPLTDARLEAERLKVRLPHAQMFEDRDANFHVLAKYAPRSTMLYFVGHGVSNGGFGALLLGYDTPESAPAFLTGDQISGFDFRRLQLVVLAACSSGSGEQYGIVNLDGLVGGFLEAGAQRVIAARWNVASGETTLLTDRFFLSLIKGNRAAESLRLAMLSIRLDPKTSHPYYWAGFQVFGAP